MCSLNDEEAEQLIGKQVKITLNNGTDIVGTVKNLVPCYRPPITAEKRDTIHWCALRLDVDVQPGAIKELEIINI